MIELDVNGVLRQWVATDPERSLLSVLREDLDLTGAKYSCGEARCGACIVLVDGQATPSCITPVGSTAGKKITTIEGLEQNGRLHPVQEAFLAASAFQCGFCTPGMILASVGLLRENPHPSDDDIVRALDNNLCRCGAYPRIVAAVRAAAAQMRKQGAQ